MSQVDYDFVPVIGGTDVPQNQVRNDLDHLDDLRVDSDLDKQIVRLLALHPNIQVRFRSQDLKKMDTGTKRTLLNDINTVLGIHQLKRSKK